jgi:hypothetical protein
MFDFSKKDVEYIDDLVVYFRTGKDKFPSKHYLGGYFTVFLAKGVGNSLIGAYLSFM